MVPGSLGCGVSVFAAMTTLTPSVATRVAIARPMPREAPEMKTVFPFSVGIGSSGKCSASERAVHDEHVGGTSCRVPERGGHAADNAKAVSLPEADGARVG